MYEDKTLVCKECGNEFVFTAGEQEFYAEKGFTNEPQRCKACRQARKNAAKTEREFFETVCAECGGTARIPFKPVEGKSYYCSECFAKRKAAELGGRIYKGEIRPRPYRNKKGTACDYCPFADVCGFDVKLPGYEYQSFQSLSVEEVLEKIREEGE